VAPQGVQKAVGWFWHGAGHTVESLNLGRFGAGKTSVATRIKILRDFFVCVQRAAWRAEVVIRY